MTHTYEITGMTCSHCAARVQKALASHPAVTEAKVTLDPPQAAITMKQHLNAEELQSVLPPAYLIRESLKSA